MHTLPRSDDGARFFCQEIKSNLGLPLRVHFGNVALSTQLPCIATMSTRLNIYLEDDFAEEVKKHKPKTLSLSSFFAYCAEQYINSLDNVVNLSAYHVGAGNEQLSQKAVSAVESVVQEKSFPPLDGDLGEGVGRESEGTPRKPPCKRAVPLPLQEHEDLIFEFWRIKGGSKSDIAWKMLMNELGKILAKYSHDKVHEQLMLAINGKWKGITMSNLTRFEPKRENLMPRIGETVNGITFHS